VAPATRLLITDAVRSDQHGNQPPNHELAWSAMVLLPTKDWATIRCHEGQIREHTLH